MTNLKNLSQRSIVAAVLAPEEEEKVEGDTGDSLPPRLPPCGGSSGENPLLAHARAHASWMARMGTLAPLCTNTR